MAINEGGRYRTRRVRPHASHRLMGVVSSQRFCVAAEQGLGHKLENELNVCDFINLEQRFS